MCRVSAYRRAPGPALSEVVPYGEQEGRVHVGLFHPSCVHYSSLPPPSLADGLFGQCQVGSVQDRPHFQVTSPVLQRLQDVLRHLMAQGEGWGGITMGWAASHRGTTGSRDI